MQTLVVKSKNLDSMIEAQQIQQSNFIHTFESWLAKSETLSTQILQRRYNKPLDIDTLWEATREDLEVRDDYLINPI